MAAASRYRGLSGSERSVVATVVGMIAPLLLLAIWQALQIAVPLIADPLNSLTTFFVPLPPPVAPTPVKPRALSPTRRSPPASRSSAQDSPEPKKRASDLRQAASTPPAPAAPIAIDPQAPVAMDLSAAPSGIALDGSAGGIGGAAGGDGGGGGNGDDAPGVVYSRAIWVRPPTADDFRRVWPRNGYTSGLSVDVVLVCGVTRNGHPINCVVRSESVPRQGFGAAAVRLAERSLVRPLMAGDKRVGNRVIIPLRFSVAKTIARPRPNPAH